MRILKLAPSRFVRGHRLVWLAVFALTGATSGVAFAGDASISGTPVIPSPVNGVPVNADNGVMPAPREIDGIGQVLDIDVLDAMRGGDDTNASVVLIDGQTNGNTADHVVSGDNVIQGGAFANAAGINTAIQNSGSNVLIQNGTAVNVIFADPGL